ncbi:sigma-70 family RNA polymerase sigma factor [Actinoplanes oblitus]|uniref:Sigma-70 family RNA polymerase sigma factor n=1 Tax=Actinoplanes oblitus TaxID=3040509 RepID=A0ABY8WAM2_9ACTN|nr:sigma-70 family RNA polymerase sigma factor [Actinoplanes oblitus]WIM93493.1 sigma-70 family RNA polymerase sigma factor [Actinoplanes oblitus]
MTMVDDEVATLVTAAQRGDRAALDRLVARHLPLIYDLVGRALGRREDTDDVVQETMLRAVRKLPALRRPASFRPWLTAIAVRQVGTHQERRAGAHQQAALLDEAADRPDPGAELEDVTAVRLALSGQRREVAEATRWLDPGDRALLALWWQEVAGRMTRPEIAATLGISVAHCGVRIQRMREELDLARGVVGALAAAPRCPELTALVAGWDAVPSPLWRKRVARHTRACRRCGAAAGIRVPAERLLAGLPALAVPAGFAEATLAKAVTLGVAGAAPVTGVAATVTKVIAAHPFAAAVAAVTAATAVAIPIVHRPAPDRPDTITAPPVARPSRTPPAAAPSIGTPPTTAASPSTVASPSAGGIALGRVSLAWAGGGYLTAGDRTDEAAVAGVDATSDGPSRRRATFVAVAGLADPACLSFRTLDGRYLRHYELRERTSAPERTAVFRGDATYCPKPGPTAGTVLLRSANYPDFCLRWTGTELGIGYLKDTPEFRTASAFRVRPPLAAS